MTAPSPTFQSLLDGLNEAHRHWLAVHDVSVTKGEQVLLYGLSDIQERNTTFDVQNRTLEFVAVADDSGGRQMLLRIDGRPTVYIEGMGLHGSCAPDEVDVLHPDFADWLADDCPLEEAARGPESVCLWLVAEPAGLQEMRRLCRAARLDWSLGQMRGSMNGVPQMLAEGVNLDVLLSRLGNDPECRGLLAVSETPDAPQRAILPLVP